MRRRAMYLLCLGVCAVAAPAIAADIAAIAYHDIVAKRNGDPYAVTLEEFERQMEYLARNGYRPIGLHALDDARAGRAPLPSMPVLLTFDDGFKSYYEHAYPVLKRYGYPSVVSVVTGWIDARAKPEIGGGFMTWNELRAIAQSPLVEVVSHTDDLHRGALANPAGSELAAAVTRIYDANAARYETEADHARRVQADLARSVKRLQAELGRAPVGIAWPYGEYDATLVDAAAALGMKYHLTLDMGPARAEDLPRINRVALKHYRNLSDFADALTHKDYRKRQLRFVEIDLEPFAGKDRAAQERLLSRLLARLELLRVNGVVIDPFSADRRRAFFYAGAIPAGADVLGRVTQQLIRRTSVTHVYLRIPPAGAAPRAALYADLARLNWFNGAVLDASLDANSAAAARAALARYKPAAHIGLAADSTPGRADFMLVELSADADAQVLAQRAGAALRVAPRALFLLRRTPATTERTLRAAMQTLRAAGAEHYGYGPDDPLNDVPSILGIVDALHEHTIAVAPR